MILVLIFFGLKDTEFVLVYNSRPMDSMGGNKPVRLHCGGVLRLGGFENKR